MLDPDHPSKDPVLRQEAELAEQDARREAEQDQIPDTPGDLSDLSDNEYWRREHYQ